MTHWTFNLVSFAVYKVDQNKEVLVLGKKREKEPNKKNFITSSTRKAPLCVLGEHHLTMLRPVHRTMCAVR